MLYLPAHRSMKGFQVNRVESRPWIRTRVVLDVMGGFACLTTVEERRIACPRDVMEAVVKLAARKESRRNEEEPRLMQ